MGEEGRMRKVRSREGVGGEGCVYALGAMYVWVSTVSLAGVGYMGGGCLMV